MFVGTQFWPIRCSTFVMDGPLAVSKEEDPELKRLRTVRESLTVCNGCLVIMDNRVVIPRSLRKRVLENLHQGHFGVQRMKQLARTAVFWPNIGEEIEATCRRCGSCAEQQNNPSKLPVHPWIIPEKPWSRLHLDHAINFLGSNWLVLTDAYSKYPCIHATQSITSRATIDWLEEDFAHFGFPHVIVTDNAASFTSEEFKTWCEERGILHLTGAPYHPATNGSAERLVQTFKNALRKSSSPPKKALQEFLQQYRRTPLPTGYSPSELLNSRQIRTRIDTLLPSPTQLLQQQQAKVVTKSQSVSRPTVKYNVGDTVYALYYGPRRERDPRWIPAVIVQCNGSRNFSVKVAPKGPMWRRH